MITISNNQHDTSRDLPDVCVGDTIPASRVNQIRLELCGFPSCTECGPLGEHGPQPGFVIVPTGDGSVFISPLDDDFEGMLNPCSHQKNRSDALSGGHFSGDDGKQPVKRNPIAESLTLLLDLQKTLAVLPDHVVVWLRDGIDIYLKESRPLDQCLGLASPVNGSQPANALHRYRNRNRHLQNAAELIAPGQRPWKQAQELSKVIFDYTTGILPANEVYNHIQAAHEIGPRVPSSPTGLAPILERK